MESVEKDKGFAKLFNVIIRDGTWAKWSPKAQAVYVVILSRANYATRKAIVTIPTIVKESGVSKDSVQEAIIELEVSGYLSKKRGGAGIKFMNIYTVYKKKSLKPLIHNINREKTVKCKPKRDPSTGKFIGTAEKTVDYLGANTVNHISRENHGKEENLETNNRDSDGSASAFSESQASPISPMLQGMIGHTINSVHELRIVVNQCGNEALKRIQSGEIKLASNVHLEEVMNKGGQYEEKRAFQVRFKKQSN